MRNARILVCPEFIHKVLRRKFELSDFQGSGNLGIGTVVFILLLRPVRNEQFFLLDYRLYYLYAVVYFICSSIAGFDGCPIGESKENDFASNCHVAGFFNLWF